MLNITPCMQSIRNIPFALFLVLLGLQYSGPIKSQSPGLQGQLFSNTSGLSQSAVTSIMQDSLGFLWIGTREGLNKYDGYSFEQFRYHPDTVSLSSNAIRCIAEGRDGVVWVGTDYGLNKLDRLRGHLWTQYLTDQADSSYGRVIHSIRIDNEGSVWLRTEKNLVRLNPDTEEFTSYELYQDDSNLSEKDESFSMVIDPGGLIWMGTKDGLQVVNPKTDDIQLHSVFPGEGLKSNKIRKVYLDQEGRIWCGTANGLYLFFRKTGSFLNAKEIMPELGSLNVISIGQTRKGELLIGTNQSLIKVLPDLKTTTKLSGFNRPDIYTRFATISAIYEDRSEILWLGTNSGLVKIDQKNKKFGLIRNEMVSSIFLDVNGDLWIGTDGMGLNLLRDGSEPAVKYNTHARVSSKRLTDDIIHSIHRDRKGNLWIGTGNGVSVMQTGTNRFRSFCSREAKVLCSLFDRQHIYDIFEDSKGLIWFAASNGIHRFDPADRSILSISRIHYGSEVLEVKDVYCVIEDPEGRIWIGSSVGLIRHDPATDKYDVYQAGILTSSSSINSNTVFSLHVNNDGELWIGTASGLNKYKHESGSFEFFNDPVELSEMRIYGIQEDSEGNLWLSSERGLATYHPELETFIQYGPVDGLQNNEFIQGSSYKHTDGRMFFGGVDGLNIFHPDSIPYNQYMPRLAFTQFVRFREQGGMSKPIALDRVSTVIVPRGVEIVTLRFAALEFTAPEKNRFMYKMVRKGQDGLWIHNGEQNYVTFYRLSPGKYTLSVRGSNNDLLYSAEEIQLEIIIPFAFWNKTIILLIYIVIAGLVLIAIIQLRTRSLRKSNRILREKEISAMEIERQRHDLARKNKNITDSINYAQRIQHALLPTNESFSNLLPESFVLFKPKDIVSGDFYWINQHGNKVYVAAVDCTGHGVPGAFVSIIGFELFRKITTSEQGSNPAMILDTLNENFTDIFSDGEQVYLNDGMDLSLCIIDRKERSLDYSGAFNPLYLVRNETIIEVKADRFSVGADVHFSAERKLFKSHKIFLQKNDIIYMFSDGYADQFGGPEGKKFKYRRFRHLLLTIHKLPMKKQQSILDASIEEWMGETEQVDDILVIGIRP
jgi:ligand-binding sensor domain-containing protein/serine phosphatase RsbU (regulator of sigma subunit)